jgi:2-methylcitrate dehydratase PrpD
VTRTTLSQALAERCSADASAQFAAADRGALASLVRTAFIDTIACILAGRGEEPTRVVHQWVRTRGAGQGDASVLFGTERADSASAALVNGVAGHALDYDDVGLAGHPSVVIVPALLAEHERTGQGGFALVQAYARGYAVWSELQRRIHVSLHARGWHPSAVFGVLAVAAAVASLRGLDARRTANALGIAASSASGVIANFGSMTKPLHLGRAAEAGIHAVELAQAGLDASADALDARAGLLVALAGDPSRVDLDSAVPEDFASTLLRMRPGIKKYPVCYAVHRVVDGVLDLAARHRFTPADVLAVQATISETTAGVLRHHDPRTLTEARFSMEFAVATAIARGRLGIAEVSASSLQDPAVRALMQRVQTRTVQTSCPLEPSFAYTDQVAVTLRDGTTLDSGPIRFARGHAELPLDDAQLREKLFSCVEPGEEPLARSLLAQVDAMLA